MRTFSLILLMLSVCTIASFGQRRLGKQYPKSKSIPAHFEMNTSLGALAACDTLNNPIPDYWHPNFYNTTDEFLNFDGYISGVNGYDDRQKANFFNIGSAPLYPYLTGASVLFGMASTNNPGNYKKLVGFRVYEDSSGYPGSQIGSTVLIPLSAIKNDVDNNRATEVIFNPGILLPASGKFYVSVDFSNFKWTINTHDSVCLYQTEGNISIENSAWEQRKDSSWNSFYEGWQFNAALLILPQLSSSLVGCQVMPVNLLSFTSLVNNNDVTLIWTIADEIGMKGYEVQKASNDGIYTTVSTVTALNNLKNQSYTATDKNAFSSASALQYRLKQIDGDGSVKYSKVLWVKSNAIINTISFANPFNGTLHIKVGLASAQTVFTRIFDLNGRLVAMEGPANYTAGINTIILNSAANLKSATYILKLNIGSEERSYKIVRQ